MCALSKRLDLLREYAEQHCPAPAANAPGYTLVFSFSDGADRARVTHVCEKSFAEAWRAGSGKAINIMARRKIKGKHLRVDWVESSQPLHWEQFLKRLGMVKRTYFRFGLAFDDRHEHLLTEAECHANAIYYGGQESATGVFNLNNFDAYAKRRFVSPPAVPSSPDATVRIISTAGVYCGQDEVLHPIPGLLPTNLGMTSRGLYTGHRKINRLTPEFLKDVVGQASHWLAGQIQPDGKFIYGYFPCFGRIINTYNTLRHASSLYSLFDVIDFTGDRSYMNLAKKGLDLLARKMVKRHEPEPGRHMAFVVDEKLGEIKLGASGAALLAYAKYRELTGSTEYDRLMTLLAEGIAFLQDPATGLFTHVLDSRTMQVKDRFRIIYYDGEAVFGLMRLYAQDKNPHWLEVARKAFDYFLGSEEHANAHDHWLSYAANEICAAEPDERYFAFGINNCFQCLDFILSRETTFPTLLELMMAAQKLLRRAEKLQLNGLLDGLDFDKFKNALHYRAHYLLNGFFWPEAAMFYKNPDSITGAFFIRHHSFRCRIDDTEHYLSGLAAYGSMLEDGDPAWAAPENAQALGLRFQPKES